MPLHIILGYDSARKDADPKLVYCGRDGDAAQTALEKSKHYRFEVLRNPVVIKRIVKDQPAPAVEAKAAAAAEAKAKAADEAKAKGK